MKNKKLTKIFIFFSVFLFTVRPVLALNNYTELSLVLEKSTFFNPEIITFDLEINSDLLINTVDARISFDPSKLKLKNASSTNSMCNFFIDETIDNETGFYRTVCGTDNPDVIKNNIINLTFEKLETGTTEIRTLADSLALQNDGLGTESLLIQETHSIYLFK